MIIALLVLLGVSLWAIAALVALMLVRRLWLSRQPGAVRCAMRTLDGQVARVGGKRWRRGWARRAGDYLIWDPMPSPFGSSVLEVRGVAEERPAEPGEVRLLGKSPAVLRVKLSSGATIAAAVPAGQIAKLHGSVPALQEASGHAGGR